VAAGTGNDIPIAGIALDTSGLERAVTESNRLLNQLVDATKKNTEEQHKSAEALKHLWEVAREYIAFEAVKAVIEKVTEAMVEFEEANIRLEAVLKATGHSAGLTFQQLQDNARDLQHNSNFGINDIERATAVLLTFRSVQGDTLKETIRLSADIAEVFGQDIQGAALQLGKALEDPIAGLTALRRIGVTFSASQKEVIRQLEESGHHLEAQRELLKGVEIQVGGTAQAMNVGLGGAIAGAKNAWHDFLATAADDQPIISTIIESLRYWQELLEAIPKTARQRLEVELVGVDERQKQVEGDLSPERKQYLDQFTTQSSTYRVLMGEEKEYIALKEKRAYIEAAIHQIMRAEVAEQHEATEAAAKAAKDKKAELTPEQIEAAKQRAKELAKIRTDLETTLRLGVTSGGESELEHGIKHLVELGASKGLLDLQHQVNLLTYSAKLWGEAWAAMSREAEESDKRAADYMEKLKEENAALQSNTKYQKDRADAVRRYGEQAVVAIEVEHDVLEQLKKEAAATGKAMDEAAKQADQAWLDAGQSFATDFQSLIERALTGTIHSFRDFAHEVFAIIAQIAARMAAAQLINSGVSAAGNFVPGFGGFGDGNLGGDAHLPVSSVSASLRAGGATVVQVTQQHIYQAIDATGMADLMEKHKHAVASATLSAIQSSPAIARAIVHSGSR
jgi:phage-related minor tail protein